MSKDEAANFKIRQSIIDKDTLLAKQRNHPMNDVETSNEDRPLVTGQILREECDVTIVDADVHVDTDNEQEDIDIDTEDDEEDSICWSMLYGPVREDGHEQETAADIDDSDVRSIDEDNKENVATVDESYGRETASDTDISEVRSIDEDNKENVASRPPLKQTLIDVKTVKSTLVRRGPLFMAHKPVAVQQLAEKYHLNQAAETQMKAVKAARAQTMKPVSSAPMANALRHGTMKVKFRVSFGPCYGVPLGDWSFSRRCPSVPLSTPRSAPR